MVFSCISKRSDRLSGELGGAEDVPIFLRLALASEQIQRRRILCASKEPHCETVAPCRKIADLQRDLLLYGRRRRPRFGVDRRRIFFDDAAFPVEKRHKDAAILIERGDAVVAEEKGDGGLRICLQALRIVRLLEAEIVPHAVGEFLTIGRIGAIPIHVELDIRGLGRGDRFLQPIVEVLLPALLRIVRVALREFEGDGQLAVCLGEHIQPVGVAHDAVSSDGDALLDQLLVDLVEGVVPPTVVEKRIGKGLAVGLDVAIAEKFGGDLPHLAVILDARVQPEEMLLPPISVREDVDEGDARIPVVAPAELGRELIHLRKIDFIVPLRDVLTGTVVGRVDIVSRALVEDEFRRDVFLGRRSVDAHDAEGELPLHLIAEGVDPAFDLGKIEFVVRRLEIYPVEAMIARRIDIGELLGLLVFPAVVHETLPGVDQNFVRIRDLGRDPFLFGARVRGLPRTAECRKEQQKRRRGRKYPPCFLHVSPPSPHNYSTLREGLQSERKNIFLPRANSAVLLAADKNSCYTYLIPYGEALMIGKKHTEELIEYLKQIRDDEGYAVVNINLEGNEIYDPYSMKEQKDLCGEIYEYIDAQTNVVPAEIPLRIKFYGDVPAEEQEEIRRMMHRHYTQKTYDVSWDLVANLRKMLLLAIFGVCVLAAYFFVVFKYDQPIFSEVLSVIGTFSLWEAANSLLLERPHLRREYKNIEQNLAQRIEFLPPQK